MSWFLAFAGFAALIVLHELGHFAAAKAVGMRVERFALFFPPMLFTVRRGETEYGVGAIPLGGYVRISGMNPNEELPPEVAPRAYYAQPPWKRIVVILAGPLVNFAIAFLVFFCILAFRGPIVDFTPTVDRVTRESPAAEVLRPGDRLLAVDGVRGDPDRLREQIATHRCAGAQVEGCSAAEPAELTILRDGRRQVLQVTPEYSEQSARALIGFQFEPIYEEEPPLSAATGSLDTMWRVATFSVERIVAIFYDAEARKEVSGPVGNYKVTQETIVEYGFVRSMEILGLISLSLAVINMFPFLPLDGGHIFWAVAEKVRGRAIPFSVLERVSVVGFMLVIFLFFIGLTNDIGRLNGEGFGVR
ncbi:MAG: Membrane-associated zinc metalloprotease [uncultured Solirubrobacteraceae bacterium]|uniref:Membrane-associated zinc metalloprotease n=1 Tax=uncultured Solirubrobacteraceae bacterium TaxID=1162706 RepID=A0A6J4R8Q2_9ACTN|nr:MAG: Membrane-associated zinc metalloprotease [uncultured Solirubrobacteraceae bacterium]